MSEEEGNKGQGFVIKDRRRFDSEGNDKSESGGSASAFEIRSEIRSAEKTPMSSSNDGEIRPDTEYSGEMPDITFSSFIMSLATQALMQLGEIKAPPGMNIEVDPAAAKQTIDILGVIEAKTAGNLDQDEKHLLDEILRNLRLSFVRIKS
ncbi:MAG: DUF1844 domain-containing protein [Deltaproteobacteria bacterium]|nr:DUF1844 domain-containing protein [Deltaproteobacteria bacterium]